MISRSTRYLFLTCESIKSSPVILAGCFDRTLRLYKGSQLVQKDENEPSVVTLVDNHTGWVRAIAHKDQICFR